MPFSAVLGLASPPQLCRDGLFEEGELLRREAPGRLTQVVAQASCRRASSVVAYPHRVTSADAGNLNEDCVDAGAHVQHGSTLRVA